MKNSHIKFTTGIVAVLAFISTSCASTSTKDVNKEPIQTAKAPKIITQYFSALQAVYHDGSSKADIDNFLNLFTKDARYIHTIHLADFDKATWRKAFMRNMERGSYKSPSNHCMLITNNIPGKDVYAIEYAYGEYKNSKQKICQPRSDRRFLAFFHLDGDKLKKVEEFWQ